MTRADHLRLGFPAVRRAAARAGRRWDADLASTCDAEVRERDPALERRRVDADVARLDLPVRCARERFLAAMTDSQA
jgi:hypothetical protein